MAKKHYKKSEINLNKKKKKPSFSQAVRDFGTSLLHEEKVLFAAILTAVVFLGMVIYAAAQLSSSLQGYKTAKVERDKIVYELSFWEQVVRSHPDYRDAYFKMALLRYQLGDKVSSKGYLQKAMEIDPNFEEGKKLKEVLEAE